MVKAVEARNAKYSAEELAAFSSAITALLPAVASDEWTRVFAHQHPANLMNDAEHRRLTLVTLLVNRISSGDLDRVLEAVTPQELFARFDVLTGRGPDPAADAVGPVFTAAGLAKWKGVSKQALAKAQKARRVIGFKTRDDVLMYPQFQFNEYGEYLPNLARVLALIDPHRVDDGGAAVWLNQSYESLDGRTAARALRDGDTDAVLRIAGEVALAWAS